jgi:hypothetical protein
MQEAAIKLGSSVVKPSIVLGYDETGQLQIAVMDGNLLRACALLHVAATKLDTMDGIANLAPGVLPFAAMPPSGNGRGGG